ncbi:MAG: hypothetical protein NTV34_05770, partial [Proteobacteria bacterium]|nr:hypothetical protein [Pseudomonadota bacterium]
MLPIIAAEIPKCHVMHLGGGSGVVCFNGDTVKNVELLELSESRHVEGLRYLTFNGLKYHGIIEEVLTWFESRTAEKLVVRQTILEIERAMTFIPDGLKILTSNDLGRNFAI